MKKNNGIGESNLLQNQFTAYLQTALSRKRWDYIRKKTDQCNHEIDTLQQLEEKSDEKQIDLLTGLPIYEQIEDLRLWKELKNLNYFEFNIMMMKALEKRTFFEIAETLELSEQATANIYYRLIRRLKKKLRGK